MFGWVQKTLESTVLDLANAPSTDASGGNNNIQPPLAAAPTALETTSSTTSVKDTTISPQIEKAIEVILKPVGAPTASINEGNNPIIQILKQKIVEFCYSICCFNFLIIIE